MVKYYPIMLDIHKKDCIVIGGGRVAERKVCSLLEYGAKVTLISPKITEKLRELNEENRIVVFNRKYIEGDLSGYYLVYVTSDDPKVNEACLLEARKEEILINVVDKPDMCDFIVPASIRRGDLTITVSTNGKSPMLSRKIREELEETFEDSYEEYVNALGELRKVILSEHDDIQLRKEIFKKIVYSNLLEKYRTGEIGDIREEIKALYKKMIKDQ